MVARCGGLRIEISVTFTVSVGAVATSLNEEPEGTLSMAYRLRNGVDASMYSVADKHCPDLPQCVQFHLVLPLFRNGIAMCEAPSIRKRHLRIPAHLKRTSGRLSR